MHFPRPPSIAALTLAVAAAVAVSGAGVAQAAAGRSRTDAVATPLQGLAHVPRLVDEQRRQQRAAPMTSTNWAGYAATGGTYTSVSSSWVQPSVSCTADGIVAFWIGLDGWGSDTVEQDGTAVDCTGGSPKVFAWWETYPTNSIQEYTNPVSTGDSLTSTITSEPDGTYDLMLTDDTRGWTENNVVAKPSGASNVSAEIIAEAVSTGGGVTPLPNFGSVGFTGSTVDHGTLRSSGAQSLTMINGAGTVIATTGTDDPAGDFTVTYGGSAPTR